MASWSSVAVHIVAIEHANWYQSGLKKKTLAAVM